MELKIKIYNKPIVEDMPKEEWKHTSYKKYMVSNYGRVKSIPIGNCNEKPYEYILIPHIVKGYYVVTLYVDKKVINKQVHRLVAETFLDNYNNLPCVNHKDENKLNNVVSNLEWCTFEHNSAWSLSKPINKIDIISKQVVDTYESAIQACKANNISINCNGNILKCCNRIKYNTYKGYIWRFVGDTDYDYPFKKHKIVKVSITDEIIEVYDSVSDAAKANNMKPWGIYNCLEHKANTANNYKWRYYG